MQALDLVRGGHTQALSSSTPPPAQPPLPAGDALALPALSTLETLPFFKTFEEIQALPGYTVTVDPKTSKIARFRGIYIGFPREVECGLKPCRQGHLSGIVVETENGDVTNIGHVCGAHYFEEFQKLKNAYDLNAERSRRLRVMRDLQNSEPVIRHRVDILRTQPLGADWLHKSYRNFFNSVPAEVINVIQERARRDESLVTHAEKVTDEDEAERIRTLQSGLSRGRSAKDPVYALREIGRLRGLAIWKDGQTVRDLLYEGVIARLDALRTIDANQLRSHALREMAEWAESIDMRLAAVETLIHEGREFFNEDNLALLARISWSHGTGEALRSLAWNYPSGAARNPARPSRRW